MIVYTPTSMLAACIRTTQPALFRENLGWPRSRVIFPALSRSSLKTEIPDVFIQKGKGKRNSCYHCKLPGTYHLMTPDSLKFWQQKYNVETSYDLMFSDCNTPMVLAQSNGIHQALCFKVFPTISGFVCAICTPTRGVRSNFWTIGVISYYSFRLLANPGRYNYEVANYSITDSNHHPWLTDASYDPEYVERQVIIGLNPDAFRSFSKKASREYAYTEYAQPNFLDNLFKEDMRINGYPGLGTNGYEFDWLVQHAFYDACQGIGKANENMLANIIDFITFIASVCSSLGIAALGSVDDISESTGKSLSRKAKEKLIANSSKVNNFKTVAYDALATPESLGGSAPIVEDIVVGSTFNKVTFATPVQVLDNSSDAWLGYRYEYCTGQSDYDQYVRYINHQVDVWWRFFDTSYHELVYGTASRNIDGVPVMCRCEIGYRPKTYEGLKSVCRYIHDAGLEINPYVLWDLIPFSFVVDWKWPLGDVFQVISDQKYYSESYYDFEFCGFSTKYAMGDKGTRYYRWYQSPPDLEAFYWFDEGDDTPSGKLILKRTLDAVSLITKL